MIWCLQLHGSNSKVAVGHRRSPPSQCQPVYALVCCMPGVTSPTWRQHSSPGAGAQHGGEEGILQATLLPSAPASHSRATCRCVTAGMSLC
jgi:hypothetical protein